MGKDCNLPKPGPRYRVDYVAGRGYLVIDPDGRPCAGPFKDENKALMSRDGKQAAADAKAKRGPRACMACGHSFRSEGIHNRLCPDCTYRGCDPDPFLSAVIRRRAA